MRRPLFCGAACLVALVAFWYFVLPKAAEDMPPDGMRVTVAGQVCQKNETSFIIKVRGVGSNQNHSNQDNSSQNHSIQRELNHVGNKLLCEYEAAELTLGAEVIVEGNFYAFEGATNQGEFDYARYYHSLGYAGRLRRVEVTWQESCAPGVRETLYRLQRYWEERLYQIFPEKEASVMTAILLGDKSGLDEEVKEQYRRNGIIHILSISGLHITILGMGLYKMLKRLGVPAWFAAVCGGGTLVLYGIMTGLGVSVCRAIGMYLIRMLAGLWGRTYDMLTALGVVGAVMVCIHPPWLEHMGFLLSFGSILGVGMLLPALSAQGEKPVELRRYEESGWRQHLARTRDKLSEGLRQGILAGVSITLTTLPIQLWFSYEVPMYSVLLNVLVLPFMSVLMVTGLIAMCIPGLGIVGTADVVILMGYEGLCRLFERLPDPMWNPGRPQLWQVALFYLLWGIVAWSVWLVKKHKKRRAVIVGVKVAQWIILAAAVVLLGLSTFRGDAVTFLDVGQGDCICVRLSSGEVYLFDCGSSSRSHVGERVLIPFLKYHGIQKIDAIFVSHGDADHMNGIIELLELSGEEHIEIGQLVLPGIDRGLWEEEFGELLAAAGGADGGSGEDGGNSADGESGVDGGNRASNDRFGQQSGVPVAFVRAGDSFGSQDTFLCLHPASDGGGAGGNEGSECFYIELREGVNRLSLLLVGDVEGKGERELLAELQERGIRDVTVFKVAHHGSKNSTPVEVLSQISPRLSVISCGRNNRYGHPHEELLERLESSGTAIYDTPHAGAVTLRLDKRGASIETYQ
ncbi:MAG: DNA internalization-related competence protein ComEC/Rec2 [Butyrivibrio sp.]|nr:DNA internalization-related competence protein ComEC/Rec2 [Muribaculum sp.]MCM1552907.1 DNA internalization-related competence protein ComEC/Rec2 [Butyrivibrio sp.]